MNKKKLVPVLAQRLSITQAEAFRFVEAMVAVITEELQQKRSFSIRGLGSLERWEQAERPGRNPRTGEYHDVPSRISVKFKPGVYLLHALNGGIREEEEENEE